MNEQGQIQFIYITTPLAYEVVSNAAIRRNMGVAEYVSLAISRQIEEDKAAEQTRSAREEAR